MTRTSCPILLRYAIAFNNISVTLLHRGCDNDAIDAIQHACQTLKIIVKVKHNPTKRPSRKAVERLCTDYEVDIRRFIAASQSSVIPKEENDTSTSIVMKHHHIHIIYLNDNVMTYHDIVNRNRIIRPGFIYPIHLEYSYFDTIHMKLVMAIHLYNFALNLYQVKCFVLSSSMRPNTTTSDTTTTSPTTTPFQGSNQATTILL
jgi:hypothetical protein